MSEEINKKKILVVNGPNLNLLGLREPGIYGSATLEEGMRALEERFPQVEFSFFQSNIEGELVDVIQQYGFTADGIVLNAGAYTHTSVAIHDAIKAGKKILLEGQLGTMKDPDHGIYPMVTSSSTLAGYGAVGAGIPPYEIKDVVTVVKAYSSAVGAGAFVSEILDEEKAKELRDHGGDKGEYGATTGRPRRVGWFDAVASRYGVRLQGATEVALTVLDCLSYLEEIPVCVAYEVDGEITKDFPNPTKLDRAKPVIEVMKGWHTDIRGITDFDKLPQEAKDYVLFIEKEIGVHISIVSTGPKREEIIYR